ncbi:MAG: kinase [Labilithrix sp.]|nr:kinase [Labilithrix sp.]
MKIAVLQKRTTYRKFVVEDHDPLLARLLRRKDPTVVRLRSSHEAHEATVHEVDEALARLGAEVVFRGGPRGRIPKNVDLAVTIGGDGTLLAASHQLGEGIPLLGINSAPEHSIGFFCGGNKGTAYETLARAMRGKLPGTDLTRMRVELNGKCLHNRVLNEALFCHASPAATTRYILRVLRGGESAEEDQRSSGLWIGPAAGSTAAQRSAGGKVLPLRSSRIQFVVRELYQPVGTRARFDTGLLGPKDRLTLRSKIRDGRVYIDGHRLEYPVTIGDVLVMRRSSESVTVLGLATKRRT